MQSQLPLIGMMNIASSLIQFSVISLFPEMFSAITDYGVVGRAIDNGIIDIQSINPRDFTVDHHRTVDDRPYGGGPGMLMKIEPLEKAILSAKEQRVDKAVPFKQDNETCEADKVIYLSPQGKKVNHQLLTQLSQQAHLILLAGRYEGIDERLLNKHVDLELSLGDFVMSGGELGAMVIIDAVTRLLPGVLGHKESAIEDSFVDGLLDHPHYTRPESFDNDAVPEVLLSGNHQAIEDWRLQQRLGRTWIRRPDLLKNRNLSQQEKKLLASFQRDFYAENRESLDLKNQE